MARKAGLPDNFDLKVSREELVEGPARLPGYLDRTGVKIAPTIEEEIVVPQKVVGPKVAQPHEVTPAAMVIVPEKSEPTPVTREQEKPKSLKAPVPRKRLQINLTADAQLMVEELVDQICQHSPEKGVNYNDVIQGLIIKLYESRSEMDVSQLPLRGRWGSPTAKSFATELSSVFGKAIKDNESQAASLFQKAVGA